MKPGAKVAVYPWIGCGQCAACKVGDENICIASHHLGVTVDGGFATHVLVPHTRYLIDYAPLPAGYAGPLMCSGLTAYAALKRLADRAARAPLLLVGLGGVGLMGLALARAMYDAAPFVADIDPKNAKQRSPPAPPGFRPVRPECTQSPVEGERRIYGACDFAGSDASLNFATGVLAKGGKVVVTGLIGGAYSTAVAMSPLKAMTIEGITTGTLTEAHELIDLVRNKNINPPPIVERPLGQASTTLDDLRAGKIVGRVVLTA